MTCRACTLAIENNLTSKPGTLSVVVSLPLNSANIEFDQTMVGPRDIVEWVEETGFDVILASNNDATQIHVVTLRKGSRRRHHYLGIVYYRREHRHRRAPSL